VPARRYFGRVFQRQRLPLGPQQLRDFGVKLPDLPRQVPNGEESRWVIPPPIINVVAVEVHEATGGEIETTAPQNMSLDRDIVEVVFLHVDGRLHLEQPPSTRRAPLENIHADQNPLMLECCFKYCRNRGIVQQAGRLRQGAIRSVFKANEHAARKTGLSEQANFIPLLKPSLLTLVRLPSEFGLINLVVEPLQALDTCHELGF
jgi:hypothetical protein